MCTTERALNRMQEGVYVYFSFSNRSIYAYICDLSCVVVVTDASSTPTSVQLPTMSLTPTGYAQLIRNRWHCFQTSGTELAVLLQVNGQLGDRA